MGHENGQLYLYFEIKTPLHIQLADTYHKVG
jgi:hypothetical protein